MTNVQSAAKAAWWILLIRGVLTAIFGLIALFSPGIALLTLVFVFGFYAILEGVTAVVLGIRARGTEAHWVWAIVQGVISVIAGVIALVWPGLTALALLFVIAFWAIVLGISEVGHAFAERQAGVDPWGWTLAAGVLNVIFGIVLLVWPAPGILALVWLVGIFALVGGLTLVGWAFRVRALARKATPPAVGNAAAA